ncbi:hypothetical protein D3C83_84550 [compost metagenome]
MPATPADARMLAPNCRTDSNTISIDASVNTPMTVSATFFSTRTCVWMARACRLSATSVRCCVITNAAVASTT